MKQLFLLFIVGVAFFNVRAQDTAKRTRTVTTSTMVTRKPLDTNEIIYDEQGKALHYYQYTKLLNTGEYTIRLNNLPGTPGVKSTLKKLDPQESLRRYALVKPQIAIKSPVLQEGKELDVTPLLGAFTKEELSKKAVFLLFWYADCPPCTENFSSLNDFFKTIADPQDIVVIAVTRDNQQTATAKLIQKPLLYARMLNNAGEVLNYYQLRTLPSYVVADKDHVIRFAVSGSAPMAMPVLKSTISQVLVQ